jgi:hypothetical protein
VGAIVPYGLHTTIAALVDLAGIFLPPSFYKDIKQDYWLLVALLARHGRCPPEHGNNHIHMVVLSNLMNRLILLLCSSKTAILVTPLHSGCNPLDSFNSFLLLLRLDGCVC